MGSHPWPRSHLRLTTACKGKFVSLKWSLTGLWTLLRGRHQAQEELRGGFGGFLFFIFYLMGLLLVHYSFQFCVFTDLGFMIFFLFFVFGLVWFGVCAHVWWMHVSGWLLAAHHRCWEADWGPLREQQVLLTSEPSPAPTFSSLCSQDLNSEMVPPSFRVFPIN